MPMYMYVGLLYTILLYISINNRKDKSEVTYFSKIGTANHPSTTAPAATYDITAIERFYTLCLEFSAVVCKLETRKQKLLSPHNFVTQNNC